MKRKEDENREEQEDRRLSEHRNRTILFFDMDCFFASVETFFRPNELKGKPIVVQQHDDIISVNYQARNLGINKHDDPVQCKLSHPDLQLVHVERLPRTSKITYRKYRQISSRVFQLVRDYLETQRSIYCKRMAVLDPNEIYTTEIASFDEIFVDVTNLVRERILERKGKSSSSLNPKLQSYSSSNSSSSSTTSQTNSSTNMRKFSKDEIGFIFDSNGSNSIGSSSSSSLNFNDPLAQTECLYEGALMAIEIRDKIRNEFDGIITCSAGISFNKLLAKLAASIRKPDQQTVVPLVSVETLMDRVLATKIPFLSSEAKMIIEQEIRKNPKAESNFYLKSASSLLKYSEEELKEKFGIRAGMHIYRAVRGIDESPVSEKGPSKTILSSMSLIPIPVSNSAAVLKVIRFISSELVDRLESDMLEHERQPGAIQFGWRFVEDSESSISIPIAKFEFNEDTCAFDAENVAQVAFSEFSKVMQQKSSSSSSTKKSQPQHQQGQQALRWIGLTAMKFGSIDEETKKITTFFTKMKPGESSNSNSNNNNNNNNSNPNNSNDSNSKKIVEIEDEEEEDSIQVIRESPSKIASPSLPSSSSTSLSSPSPSKKQLASPSSSSSKKKKSPKKATTTTTSSPVKTLLQFFKKVDHQKEVVKSNQQVEDHDEENEEDDEIEEIENPKKKKK